MVVVYLVSARPVAAYTSRLLPALLDQQLRVDLPPHKLQIAPFTLHHLPVHSILLSFAALVQKRRQVQNVERTTRGVDGKIGVEIGLPCTRVVYRRCALMVP